MSDFPKGGDVAAARAWLDKEGFEGFFNGWKADAVLGTTLEVIKGKDLSEDRAEMLWCLLNTAKDSRGNFKCCVLLSYLILRIS